ncbi:MAG TPA: hypothetical protein VMY35_04570 [Phycisphaerae bacterium]|nr:hypothetical protein [Phycisphaerae bacterium]
MTLEIPPATQAKIDRGGRAAKQAGAALAAGLEAAAVGGAEEIRELLLRGELGLDMRHPGSGLAASLAGWMIDDSLPLAAVGVPANSPAAAYAGILERGGTITPKSARLLAIPVSEEARRYSSPRDMPDLTLISRKASGKPPLLVRQLSRRGDVRGFELHWVLVPSVTIEPRRWLSRGAARVTTTMAGSFQDVLDEYAREW